MVQTMKWNLRLIIINILLLFSAVGFGQNMIMNNAYQTIPQIGVMVQNVTASPPTVRANVIKNTLGSRYGRFTAIAMRNWSGSSNVFDAYFAEGIINHVVIDVGTSTGDDVPWITATSNPYNLADLAVDVDDLLDTYPTIRTLTLDNEELQNTYHQEGRLFQYIDIAEVVQPICKAHGVKLSNGGFGDFFAINGFIFRWIKGFYGQDSADSFADKVFSNGTSGNPYDIANDPNFDPTSSLQTRIKDVDTIVSFDGWDLLNFHMYNPIDDFNTTPFPVNSAQIDIWRYYAEGFRYANTDHIRPSMNNETGQRETEAPEMVANMLPMFWRLRFFIVDWWSGFNSSGLMARPLTEDNGTIQPNGVEYRNFSDRYDGRPFP